MVRVLPPPPVSRCAALIRYPCDTVRVKLPDRAESGAPLLDLRKIRVMRGGKIVLHDFTFRVHGNEHVAVLGPNGCGKSTLIKTITRECYPVARENSGITILGHERWNVFELRLLLGIVSNDLMASCTGDATGRDIVLSGFFSSTRVFRNHQVQPEHLRLAEAALGRLEALHLAERPVAEMSSGEARRILIARALDCGKL